MTADAIEQRVRFLRNRDLGHYGDPVHRVVEFVGRNPGLWVDGNDHGLTFRSVDGHAIEVHADVIRAAHAALDATEQPIPCSRVDCLNLAHPDDPDQACAEHGRGRRWP